MSPAVVADDGGRGLVIGELSELRLARQLDAAPAWVTQVVGALAPLPAGASFQTYAEHLALLPLTARDLLPPGADPPAGVVVRRADGPHTGGRTLVDHGAVAHDPTAVEPVLEPASPFGRSPFPRRPVLVLLGLETPADRLEWARRTANALLAEGVEARLAVRRFPTGDHLTRPCLADPGSLATLHPNAVIPLDDEAAAVVDDWCEWRATAVIDLTPAGAGPAWSVDPASRRGRHRARVSLDVAVPDLAGVVHRLAAGPQVLPPVTTAATPVASPSITRPRPTRAAPAALRMVAWIADPVDPRAAARAGAWCRELERRGDRARWVATADDRAEAGDPDLLVVAGSSLTPAVHDLVAQRRAAGRRTVIDLGPGDRALDDRPGGVHPSAWPAVEAAGLVTTPSLRWCQELDAAGVRVHRLPRPPEPEGGGQEPGWGAGGGRQELGRGAGGGRPTGTTIVWDLGPADQPVRTDTDAVAGALVEVLDELASVRLLVTGDLRALPPTIPTHPRVSVTPGPPSPAALRAAPLVVWTPHLAHAELGGDVGPVLAAATAGVPTLVERDLHLVTEGVLPAELLVDDGRDASAWRDAVRRLLLLDPGEAAALGDDLVERSGAATSVAIAERALADLLSWAFRAPLPTPEDGP